MNKAGEKPPKPRGSAFRPKTLLLLALLATGVLGWFSDKINPYYADVLTKVGINIILAVSLNLVNGYTGQFASPGRTCLRRTEKDQQGSLKELSEESANPRTPKPINKHSCC